MHNQRRTHDQFRLPHGGANPNEYHIRLSVFQMPEQVSRVEKPDNKRDREKS